ncbi:hypothetical protein R3X27_14155 [Tropicimonas sp. TH_r6]|uniref:hypothetical protein n=1 Tax=Tropicimonas sp. TH_r6 TaxID=3082085 RepID=UPI002954113C|nr:hypothetical protein [Tropicimonas sp. TH_r6]MDV7143826.1 hypothetical protein [Tropicimonas sp. TH_r6]
MVGVPSEQISIGFYRIFPIRNEPGAPKTAVVELGMSAGLRPATLRFIHNSRRRVLPKDAFVSKIFGKLKNPFRGQKSQLWAPNCDQKHVVRVIRRMFLSSSIGRDLLKCPECGRYAKTTDSLTKVGLGPFTTLELMRHQRRMGRKEAAALRRE